MSETPNRENRSDRSNTERVNKYECPELTEYGPVETLTAGNTTGQFLDESFPRGTPVDDLTFS